MKRVIPSLTMYNGRLVKSSCFQGHSYIGDPINSVRIFSDLEADEICLFDIRQNQSTEIDFRYLEIISSESSIPLSYGGRIRSESDAARVIATGFERVVLNTSAYHDPALIAKTAELIGTQSTMVSIDYSERNGFKEVFVNGGQTSTGTDVFDWSLKCCALGAGQLMITSIDRDGSNREPDYSLYKRITSTVTVPIIASGGIGHSKTITKLFKSTDISGVAIGKLALLHNGECNSVVLSLPNGYLRHAHGAR